MVDTDEKMSNLRVQYLCTSSAIDEAFPCDRRILSEMLRSETSATQRFNYSVSITEGDRAGI